MENNVETMRNKAINSLLVSQCLLEGMKREIEDGSIEYYRFEAARTKAMKAIELLIADQEGLQMREWEMK